MQPFLQEVFPLTTAILSRHSSVMSVAGMT